LDVVYDEKTINVPQQKPQKLENNQYITSENTKCFLSCLKTFSLEIIAKEL